MRLLLLIWMLNALALLAVGHLVPGIHLEGFGDAMIAALFLGLINTLIRPLLIILTLPATVITMGLSILVINGLLFWLTGSVLKNFIVDGFGYGLAGATLYSVFSWALSAAATQIIMRK